MKQRLYLALRVIFALAGLAFLGLALVDALQDPDLTVLPDSGALLLAIGAVVAGLWAQVLGWSRLLGVQQMRVVARGFLLAQLGKYIPGGVWQVVGQVGDATRSTNTGGRSATLAYLTMVVAQVTAGLLVGLPLALDGRTPTWIRVGLVAATAVAVAMVAERRILARVLLALPWLRGIDDPAAMPSRAALVTSTAAGVVAMLAAGVVFEIAYAAPPGEHPGIVVPAYALAWTVGFLAVPFPAGLGVREAALLLLLPDGSRTSIVAASAVVRVVYIVGELVALAVSWLPRIGVPRP